MIEKIAEVVETAAQKPDVDLKSADSVLEKMNDSLFDFDDGRISDSIESSLSDDNSDRIPDSVLDRFNEIFGEEAEAVDEEPDNAESSRTDSVLDRFNEDFFRENQLENYEGLTDEEKQKIKEETGWSDEIVDSIKSMDEYKVYKDADLTEAEIDGKKCLIRSDIDWNQKDAMGRTNKERAEQGLSPINKDGKVLELHHIGQRSDSPLAELTTEEHRGKDNDTVLHDKTKDSEIDRVAFGKERADHWESRAKQEDINDE